MNLSQLQYFKRLAEVLNYTKAAHELYIAQPTLSGSIMSLEKELGVKLFKRDGRTVSLTPQGSIFYDYVCASLKSLEDGISAVHQSQAIAKETISVGAVFTVQDDYLPPLVGDFIKKTNGAASIHVSQGLTDYLIDQLEDEKIDLAFCGRRTNTSHVSFIPVTSRDLIACVKNTSKLADRTEVSLTELSDYHIISYSEHTPIGEMCRKLFNKYKTDGVGMAFSDDIAMASYISFNDPNLVGIMLDSLGLKLFSDTRALKIKEAPEGFYQIYLAYNDKKEPRPIVKQFIDFARERAEKSAHKEQGQTRAQKSADTVKLNGLDECSCVA